jgi:hypothetical protein
VHRTYVTPVMLRQAVEHFVEVGGAVAGPVQGAVVPSV